ncbi:unnamed protein product, partial [Ixodes persulcatus]
MIRDQVIFGINNEEFRMKLLKLEDPALETVAKVCPVHETSANHLKAFRQDPSMTKQETDPLHAMKTTKPKQHSVKLSPTKTCRDCGKAHVFNKTACPAWGKECSKCRKKNHFAKQCKSRDSVRAIQESNSSSEEVLSLQKKK